jgi:hypothetical protein
VLILWTWHFLVASRRHWNRVVSHPGSGGVSCFACDAGKFKSTSGTGNCSLCPAYTYLGSTGATSEDSCSRCPFESFASGQGATTVAKCNCRAGWTGTISSSSDTCVQCAAGKFKTTAGNAECTNCTAGTFSATIGKEDSTCSPCNDYSNSPSGSMSISACVCSAGYGLG